MTEDKRIRLLFANTDYVVIEKDCGLLSVPGRGPEKQDCVVSRVREIFPDSIAQPSVHRLDMHTSGLMVLARNKETHRALSIQFEKRQVKKIYIALLEGEVEGDSGTIELPFRLDLDNRPHQIYDSVHGKLGLTHWKKIEVKNNITRIQFEPITGRTHQLRLHASHNKGLGVPIVGDTLYGNGEDGDLMYLHATKLAFFDPATNKRVSFSSPPLF